MPGLRHALMTVRGSHGFEYGTLRDFEDEIVRVTGATVVSAPSFAGSARIASRLAPHLAHGTRYAPLRRLVPRQPAAPLDADVLWLVLMGPESSQLDMFREWGGKARYRIVYLFDTFEQQLPAVRALLRAGPWDLLVTSFHGAVSMLERETGRRWVAVPQGVKLDRFAPVPEAERIIGVTSYGRRVEAVHDTIDRWSDETGVYYESSIAASIKPSVKPAYLYKQYSWHVRHSAFTVSWPVEVTHPARAGSFSPITCRWFEAAAAGTVMIGRPPADPVFASIFGEGAVLPLDAAPRSPGETRAALEEIWSRRGEHLRAAEARRAERVHTWTWEARVREILALAKLE